MTTKLTNNIEHIGTYFDVEQYNLDHDTDYLKQIYHGYCIQTGEPYQDTYKVISVGLSNGKVLWWKDGLAHRQYAAGCAPHYSEKELEFIEDNYMDMGAEYCAVELKRNIESIKQRARKMGLLVSKM